MCPVSAKRTHSSLTQLLYSVKGGVGRELLKRTLRNYFQGNRNQTVGIPVCSCRDFFPPSSVDSHRFTDSRAGRDHGGIRVRPLIDGDVRGGGVAIQGSTVCLPGGQGRCWGFLTSVISPKTKNMPMLKRNIDKYRLLKKFTNVLNAKPHLNTWFASRSDKGLLEFVFSLHAI